MAKSSGDVASEGPFGWGRRKEVVAEDGRIFGIGLSGRENRLAKCLETTGVGKGTFFFGLVGGFTLGDAVAGLRVATLGGGSLGGLVQKKVSRVRIAVVPEVPTSWKALAGAGFLISWMI